MSGAVKVAAAAGGTLAMLLASLLSETETDIGDLKTSLWVGAAVWFCVTVYYLFKLPPPRED